MFNFVFQIIVNISVHSVDGLRASIESNILRELLNDVKSKDILVQLTSLETVTKLALTNHGLQFLKEDGFMQYIQEQLNDSNDLNSLLLPGMRKDLLYIFLRPKSGFFIVYKRRKWLQPTQSNFLVLYL